MPNNKLKCSIAVKLQRRPAIQKLYNVANIPDSLKMNDNNEVNCWVLGLFQEGNAEETIPVFVVEYEDGSTDTVGIGSIRFVDATLYGDGMPMVQLPTTQYAKVTAPPPCCHNCFICNKC